MHTYCFNSSFHIRLVQNIWFFLSLLAGRLSGEPRQPRHISLLHWSCLHPNGNPPMPPHWCGLFGPSECVDCFSLSLSLSHTHTHCACVCLYVCTHVHVYTLTPPTNEVNYFWRVVAFLFVLFCFVLVCFGLVFFFCSTLFFLFSFFLLLFLPATIVHVAQGADFERPCWPPSRGRRRNAWHSAVVVDQGLPA